MNSPYLGENLIFVISQPRSGSTLLQRILFGHPDVQTSAETWLMLHPAYGLRKEGISAEYGAAFAREGVEEFLDNYTSGRAVYLDAIREWARVIYQNAIDRNGKRWFLDKTPRYFFIIHELHELFPRARFIFLLRNPLAVLASELNTYVKGDWPILGVFNADLLSAPGWIVEGIDELGDSAYVIHYEKFVTEPDTAIPALCDYLGLDFRESMLDYSATPKPVGKYNDPVGIDQHTKPSSSSVDKWKKMADDDQSLYFAQRYLDALGEDTISRMGYEYGGIFDVLHSRKLEKKGLYPWSIAIQPQAEWTLCQHFVSDLYFSRKEHGSVGGFLKAGGKNLRKGLRSLRRALSCPGKR